MIDKLAEDFSNLRADVKADLDDYGKRLDMYIEHSDAIQRQVQESLQRQLDQNNNQHKEMMDVFKDQNRVTNEQNKTSNSQIKEQMSFFINNAQTAIESIIAKQEKEDIDRNARHTKCEDRLTILETAPIRTSSDTWKTVKLIAITTLATAVVMGCAIFTKDFIENTTKIQIPMEVKQ
jgi:Flp pilus assembly protein TadB